MKLTSQKIKRLIKESILKEMGPAFPVDILDDIDYFEKRGLDSWRGMEIAAKNQFGDISLSKMIMKYLEPHKDKLRLDIFWNDWNITVSFKYNNTEIGETSATEHATSAGDTFFVVGWGGTLEGKRDSLKSDPKYNHIDQVFKTQGGYGPITYEIAIEYLSLQGEGLTSDREAVSNHAYNLWKYYYNNRSDVQKRLIDFDENSTGYGRHNSTIISAEKWYEIETGYHSSKESVEYSDHPDLQPELTDDQLRVQFINYLKKESPLMQVYSKNTQPFLQAVRDLGVLYINNDLIQPGEEIT